MDTLAVIASHLRYWRVFMAARASFLA